MRIIKIQGNLHSLKPCTGYKRNFPEMRGDKKKGTTIEWLGIFRKCCGSAEKRRRTSNSPGKRVFLLLNFSLLLGEAEGRMNNSSDECASS